MRNFSVDKAQLFEDLLISQGKSFNAGLSFQGPQIAAEVAIPDVTREYATNVIKDYPQLPKQEGTRYKAFGLFGDTLPLDSKQREFGYTTPGDSGLIRGMMNFVPGGIPASTGFNYEESLKKYPEYMKGIPKGNMPVYQYYTPY